MEQETKKETTETQNDLPQVLHTFKTDTSEYIKRRGISSIDILGAEARKGKTIAFEEEERPSRRRLYIVAVSVAVILGLAGTIFWKLEGAPGTPTAEVAEKPIILPDQIKETDLQNLKSSLGKNTRINTLLHIPIVEFQGVEKRHISAETFFYSLSPYPPSELFDAIDTKFMFGEFYFSRSSGVLIFGVKSFSHAVSGMFGWENNIVQSLSPVLLIDSKEIVPGFKDKVVNSRDARALGGKDGNVALIYSFIGHDYLVITTSEEALKEVFRRLI